MHDARFRRLWRLLSSLGLGLITTAPLAAAPSTLAQDALGDDSAACGFTAPPLVERSEERTLYKLWEQEPDPRLWQPNGGSDAGLANYRAFVSDRVDPDPTQLMRRQQALLRRYGLRDRNLDIVLAGQAGALQPTQCLDALLMAEHLRARGWGGDEFIALAMQHSVTGRVRVHFESFEGTAWVAPRALADALTDASHGWRFVHHLRSRAFTFDQRFGDVGGTLVPSSQFVRWYRILANDPGLPSARITNGFDSVVLGEHDFYRLSTDYP